MAIAVRATAGADLTTNTTGFTVTIPASTLADDILILITANKGATTDPTIVDNDTGGNLWVKLAGADNTGSGDVWWKRATSATASKTITGSGCTGSCSASLAVFSGCLRTGTPYEAASAEANASADETHASISALFGKRWLVLCIANLNNDNAVTLEDATDPNTITHQIEHLNTGGTDCATVIAAAAQAAVEGGAVGSITWAQTNGITVSVAFMLIPQPEITFLEPGTDATGDLTHWTSSSGTVASATDQPGSGWTGPRTLKCSTMNPAVPALVRRAGVLEDAGRRQGFRFAFDVLPNASNASIAVLETAASAASAALAVNTTGTMSMFLVGGSSAAGTTVLAVNTVYLVTWAYTITNSTTYRFNLFINGVFELSVTAIGTLPQVTLTQLRLNASSTWGVDRNLWFDDIYVDDGADYTDPGNIRVTAKRPNTNGTTNGFTTQIGAGGSGYGSGHSPQVNERPLSQTNGWAHVGAGSAITEEYNVEDAAVGDAVVNTTDIRGVMGWTFAKSLAAETAKIKVDGTQTNIALTSTPTLFTQLSATPFVYPAGAGLDIGIITATDLTTVSLYECGIIVASLAKVVGTQFLVNQAVQRSAVR